MNAQELIEAVSKRIRTSFEWWMSDEGRFPRAIERRGDGYLLAQSQTCWDAWAASARLAVDPALQPLISERDAALARAAELEARDGELAKALGDFAAMQRPMDPEILKAIASTDMWKLYAEDAPNVRDAGPTPYSGRTIRREG